MISFQHIYRYIKNRYLIPQASCRLVFFRFLWNRITMSGTRWALKVYALGTCKMQPNATSQIIDHLRHINLTIHLCSQIATEKQQCCHIGYHKPQSKLSLPRELSKWNLVNKFPRASHSLYSVPLPHFCPQSRCTSRNSVKWSDWAKVQRASIYWRAVITTQHHETTTYQNYLLLFSTIYRAKCTSQNQKVLFRWNTNFFCDGILLIWSTKWSLFKIFFAQIGRKSRDESNDAN